MRSVDKYYNCLSNDGNLKTVHTASIAEVDLEFKVTPDAMKLFCDAKPKGGKLTRDKLLGVLSEFLPNTDFVNIGVIDSVVAELNEGHEVKERRLVKGEPAEAGHDGKVLLLVKKFTGKGQVAVNNKGFADFSNMHLFDNIIPGTPIARIYHPKAGAAGRDAMGKTLESQPGKPAKISIGEGLEIIPAKSHEQYDVVLATKNGFVSEKGEKLEVSEALQIDGDVDFRFGNLDFIGSIEIKGDVLPGFVVKAKKGIVVNGSVKGGNLTTVEGDIVVKGLIHGGDGARVISGRSLKAKGVEGVNAEIVGNIEIEREARDSVLRTKGAIFAPKAHLIGGRALVVKGLEVGELGSASGAETIVQICSDVETSIEYGKLTVDIENHERASGLLKLHLGPLVGTPTRIQLLRSPHKEKMQALLDKLTLVDSSLQQLHLKRKEMLASGTSAEAPRLNVWKMLHAGVNVNIAGTGVPFHDPVAGPVGYICKIDTQVLERGELQTLGEAESKTDNTKGEKREQKK